MQAIPLGLLLLEMGLEPNLNPHFDKNCTKPEPVCQNHFCYYLTFFNLPRPAATAAAATA